ncbi:MAG TPA: class II glutamine amidotransferase [Polyangiaceae bacterium]|nr:class II glutamine amidotransferase [Polyangiaceae bacterium]
MCRLLGVVSSETTHFGLTLHEAPRSLAMLSAEHPHGWGLAVHRRETGWDVHKHAVRAGDCPHFRALAASARGEVLVAHIRKRTVGPVGRENTHPFRRGRWVFAHNGTIEDIGWFAARASAERLREVEGETDSERFFAFLLTALDEAGDDRARVDAALARRVDQALAHPGLGAANFLLSDGASLWAFRAGRTLHVLTRLPGDEVVPSRRSHETDAELLTPWSPQRHAVLIASEHLTDEPWGEVAEGTLLRVDAGPAPEPRVVRSPRG